MNREHYATCLCCHEKWPLSVLVAEGIDLEPSTNFYEEDVVSFLCPTTGDKVVEAKVTL